MPEYEFLRPPLGRGAFGVTFKARKRGADAIVAIKRSTRGTDDEATRAIREAIHLLRLDHRNLVKVLDVFLDRDPETDEPRINMVMEYCTVALCVRTTGSSRRSTRCVPSSSCSRCLRALHSSTRSASSTATLSRRTCC